MNIGINKVAVLRIHLESDAYSARHLPALLLEYSLVDLTQWLYDLVIMADKVPCHVYDRGVGYSVSSCVLLSIYDL